MRENRVLTVSGNYAISWRNCLPNWIILVGKSVIMQVCLKGTFSKLSNISYLAAGKQTFETT